MKIAIFTETYYPFISGVVTHVETLKNGLEAMGHEVLIVTMNPKVMFHYQKDGVLYCPSIPLKRIYGYGLANPLNLRRLSLIKAFQPDILHIHTEFSMGIFGEFAARKLKKPIVYTLHTMYDDYLFYVAKDKWQEVVKPAAYIYFRKVANKATEVIGPSLKVVEFLRRCGVERHINIIPNTVDLSDFLPENVKKESIDAVRTELGIGAKDTALCFVGRLGKEKSIDVLLDYFAAHFRGNPHCKLFIIGDGPERDALGAQIAQLGLQQQVRLLGRIEHNALPPYYRACNLFATASLSEMNSIAMLEAMASGLYVLQRFDLYNKNQIKTGENGATYETAEDLCALITEQMHLNDAQRLARSEGVTACATRYGQKEFMAAVMNVYQRAQKGYEIKQKSK